VKGPKGARRHDHRFGERLARLYAVTRAYERQRDEHRLKWRVALLPHKGSGFDREEGLGGIIGNPDAVTGQSKLIGARVAG
jgi:hypothetical protein